MSCEYSNALDKEILINILEKLALAKQEFPYAALAFILKPDDLMNFFDYFEGTTIKVPAKEDFIRLVQTCLVEAVQPVLEKNSESDNTKTPLELAKAVNPEMLSGLTKQRYQKISAVLKRLEEKNFCIEDNIEKMVDTIVEQNVEVKQPKTVKGVRNLLCAIHTYKI